MDIKLLPYSTHEPVPESIDKSTPEPSSKLTLNRTRKPLPGEISTNAATPALFRKQALQAAGHRLFGSVAVIVPPSGTVTLLISLFTLLALSLIAVFVEVPLRSRAIGVLMPPGGFSNVFATESARVIAINVVEGQIVAAGDRLLQLAPERNALNRESLSALQLQSLHRERELLHDVRNRQAALDASRLVALDEQIISSKSRLRLAQSESGIHREQLDFLRQRHERLKRLAKSGHVAEDVPDAERALIIQARAAGTEIGRRVLEYEHNIQNLLRSREEMLRQAELSALQQELLLGQLNRDIDASEFIAGQEIRASTSGIVARINVHAGSAVRPGQTLVRMHDPDEALEAWLYLSSARAGLLRTGQEVHLQLDAFPHEIFGSKKAIVTSVSTIALVPEEIRVPLAISGPVFEVRARLTENTVTALGSSWPLSPGTSFQADIVQHRYRLYQWFTRAFRDETANGQENVGSPSRWY